MKKLITFLVLISLTIFFIFSCQKDKSTTYPGGNSSYTSIRTTVTGMVLDETNAPLTGVTVTAYGQTTTTNQYGTFVLKNINANKDRCVLQFSKTGFFKRAHGFIASANTVNYVRIILLSNAATQNFSASAGGTVSLADGSSVLFQPNSIVTTNGSAYTGTVNLIVKHLSPDAVNFGFTIPGGDLLGKDLNDNDVALYTYGMLGVELTGSSGEALQLAAGTSATLTMSIAASQLSTAPASIPLWYFDETTSLWKEEGTATKVGTNYVGTVGHFSWWNYDYKGLTATIKGKVVDCDGNPVPNVVVTINGICTLITDQDGEFQNWIPAGLALTVQVLTSNNPWLSQNSQLINVAPLSLGQVFPVPDLVIPCNTRVAGIIKSCSGETSEGFVSLSNNSGFFIYQYATNGSFNLMSIPNAQLDLNAFSSSTFYHQTLTSLFPPHILNVGNVLLCDSTILSGNSFILNGGPFSNKLFILTPLTTPTGSNDCSGTYTCIYWNGYSSSDTIQTLGFWMDTTVEGFTYGHIQMDIFDSTYFVYYVSAASVQPTFHITEIGPIGGRIKGNFSSGCAIQCDTAIFSNCTISGAFDVERLP